MRPNRFVSFVLCSLAAMFIAAVANKSGNVAAPPVVLTGPDSHVKEPMYERIESEVEWKKTWLNHLGMKDNTIVHPAMEVDFSHYEVVAIFGGESSYYCGFRVNSVTERDDSIMIRFEGIFFMTHGKPVRVMPFAFIVLPKSDKPITLETWKSPQSTEVARLTVKKE